MGDRQLEEAMSMSPSKQAAYAATETNEDKTPP